MEIVVAPPFTALHAVAEAPRNSNVGVAAQDLYWEREGAFTGEVSARDDQGSRRRVRDHRPLRAAAAVRRDRCHRSIASWPPPIAAGLTPIVCIGETLEERERNETLAVLDRQMKYGLDGLTAEQVARPGRSPTSRCGRSAPGRNATPAQAARPITTSASGCASGLAADAAEHCHVIYGGSVKPDNIARTHARARRGRRPGRRRQPRRAELRRHRDEQPAGYGIMVS